MNRMRMMLMVILAATVLGTGSARSQDAAGEVLAQRFFEEGLMGEAPSQYAPAATSRMDYTLGAWAVTIKTFSADTLAATRSGYSRITYMNRGHAFMEQFASDDFDGTGTSIREFRFLAAQATAPSPQAADVPARWLLGTIDSHTETVSIADGVVSDGGELVVQTSRRIGGGGVQTNYRTTIRKQAPGFIVAIETSGDHGLTWQREVERTYAPMETNFRAKYQKEAAGFGAPSADRPAPAADFDFLVGSWISQNELVRPGGQAARWPANALVGHVLGGNAVMEYVWFDLDPSLPDAATTIVRIYNRNMQRWECLYLANRGNGMLHFGGVRQGEEVVLTTFGVGTNNTISRFVFHNIERDTYAWYAESSNDRGKTWARTWKINYARQ